MKTLQNQSGQHHAFVHEESPGVRQYRVCTFLIVLVVWLAGGAACPRQPKVSELPPPPLLFREPPNLDALIAAVNRSDAVEKMQSTSATVELLDSNLPVSKLSANIAVKRPRGLRVQVSLPMGVGSGLDVGSNDEVFWLRHPSGMYQTLLFARHDEYLQNMLGAPIPVPPAWIIDAIGLVHIHPPLVVGEPLKRGDGQYELRTQIPTPSGSYNRVLIIDGQGGFVREQHVYAPTGRLVARSNSNEHRYYSSAGVVLPHDVQVFLEPQGSPTLGLSIKVGDYAINQLLGSDSVLFTMPAEGNGEVIDLGKLSPTLPPAQLQASEPSSASATLNPRQTTSSADIQPNSLDSAGDYVPTASYRPAYRGVQLR